MPQPDVLRRQGWQEAAAAWAKLSLRVGEFGKMGGPCSLGKKDLPASDLWGPSSQTCRDGSDKTHAVAHPFV